MYLTAINVVLFALLQVGIAAATSAEITTNGELLKLQKSVLVKSFSEGIIVGEKAIPVPKSGEVLVKVTARPVNPAGMLFICMHVFVLKNVYADVFSIGGFYPGFQPKSFPATPGG